MKTVIRTESLYKYYYIGRPEEVHALNDINLEISKNQSVVIHGPSGCGKTTLLSLISTIDRPTEGRVSLYDQDVSGFSDVELSRIRRKTMGFIFQNFNLLLRLSAWENVAFPLIPMGTSEKERYKRACDLLTRLGLEKRIHHTPEEMSGGEQQRVAIARALINNPDIIIADEPTSNIDAESVQKLLNILENLKKEGKTIIVSSHDPIFNDYGDVTFHLVNGDLAHVRKKE